jgi:cytochrome b
VALVAGAFSSAFLGGTAMEYHLRCGYAILGLVLFRLGWGVLGGHASRFTSFVKGPREVLAYARALAKGDAPRHLGHNPLGALSILAMLTMLGLQAVTGLFANDDIFTAGPLSVLVSKSASDTVTGVHRVSQQALMLLIALHLAAVIFYWWVKGENLIVPMITGRKAWHGPVPPRPAGHCGLALLLALAAAASVCLIVRR